MSASTLSSLLSKDPDQLRPGESEFRVLITGNHSGLLTNVAFQCAYDLAKLGHRPLFVCSKALKDSSAMPSVIALDDCLRDSASEAMPRTRHHSAGSFSTLILKRIGMYYCEDSAELRVLTASLHLFPDPPTVLIIDNISDKVLGSGISKFRCDSQEGHSRMVQAVGFVRDALRTLSVAADERAAAAAAAASSSSSSSSRRSDSGEEDVDMRGVELGGDDSTDPRFFEHSDQDSDDGNTPQPPPLPLPLPLPVVHQARRRAADATASSRIRLPLIFTAGAADLGDNGFFVLRLHLLLTHAIDAKCSLTAQQQQQQKQEQMAAEPVLLLPPGSAQAQDQGHGNRQALPQQLHPSSATMLLAVRECEVAHSGMTAQQLQQLQQLQAHPRRFSLQARKPEELVESTATLLLTRA